MDRLSSCYFCGGALDVSLSEYPVVPRELQSGDEADPTVVLCPTCRRKLAGVVETVADAATDAPSAGRAQAGTTVGASDASPTDDGTASDGDERDEWGSPGETSDLRTPSAGDPTDSEGDPGETSDLRSPSEGRPADGEESVTDLGTEADDAGNADSGTEEAASSNASDDTGSADDSGDGPTMTKLEYNKVMRLLKNREFPVDRAEIREVATSAYGIDADEFDAVVDAAVSRDLIAEENGQFVAPE